VTKPQNPKSQIKDKPNKTITTHDIVVEKLQHRRLRESITNKPRLKQQEPPSPQQQQLMSP